MPYFQNKFRFALVSHSEIIANIVRSNIDYGTENLFTKIVGVDDAVSVSEALIKDGYEVIIVHSGTAAQAQPQAPESFHSKSLYVSVRT